MVKRIFTRKVPVFGNIGWLIICIIFFLLPFALRGARMAVSSMKNNVADWLPSDYEETQDLSVFRQYFVGDVFVVASGPWCYEGNPTYINLLRKIEEESLEYESVLAAQKSLEVIRAHRTGDKYGLLPTGNYHEDWGEQREKWLQGRNDKWYWVNRRGELYEWEGENNVLQGVQRLLERLVHGRNKAVGRYIDTFGPPPNDAAGIENPFYQNPELLCGRPFKSVSSGPEVLEQMAGPGGTLRIGRPREEDAAALEARIEAHRRLTGSLFGPTPPPQFRWSFDSLLACLRDEALVRQLSSSPHYRQKFDTFVQVIAGERFGGDVTAFERAQAAEQLELWFLLWDSAFELPAPPRQTCLVVTINEPFLGELKRIVGRPGLGRPRGRLLELATGKCGLASSNLHLGGPPSDNVAIDEEGSKTLLKLALLSGLVGIVLSYYSFRSFRVTLMLFFLGGVSAISSLGYVWYFGHTLDAILMTMPSLIYVGAISSGVHLINYYRDACHEHGPRRAAEIAAGHAWFPSLLCALTTAIGLGSLCTSNLMPIWKFGFFSAIGTVATVALVFAYLPSSLAVWPPGYKRLEGQADPARGAFFLSAERFFDRTCSLVLRHNLAIVVAFTVLIAVFAWGTTRIDTTVQLLKLFDRNAKVLQDYHWLEENLGTLVPMEVILNIPPSAQQELLAVAPPELPADPDAPPPVIKPVQRTRGQFLAYSMLERMELSARIRRQLERFFGPEGLDIVGAGMSTDVFAPVHTVTSQVDGGTSLDYRRLFNDELLAKKQAMVAEDYLAVAGPEAADGRMGPGVVPGQEMWRISLRLAALNDVDYGRFVNDLKCVVEPVLRAYEFRTRILDLVADEAMIQGEERSKRILLLGRDPRRIAAGMDVAKLRGQSIAAAIDQTFLFSDTLEALLQNRGMERGTRPGQFTWMDPLKYTEPPDSGEEQKAFPDDERWGQILERFDCVVMVEDHPLFREDFIRRHARAFVDCREHRFVPGDRPVAGGFSRTASNRVKAGEALAVSATYTGIVPIVYKAQRALLRSLNESIMMSFGLIALVMMVLMRDWQSRFRAANSLNVGAGLVSMLPNVFPVVLVFGAMGFLGFKVDIGSMMTASVALGIAVDDTIHYLTWFRRGLAEGLSRQEAVRKAYRVCASAMLQTTLIAGFGLSVFALSTFAPTQRFGVLMLVLLGAALVGDLVLLPAILSSPLGALFGKTSPRLAHPEGPAASATVEVAELATIPISRPGAGPAGRRGARDGLPEPRNRERR